MSILRQMAKGITYHVKENIAHRDMFKYNMGDRVFVIDATLDPRIKTGGAEYTNRGPSQWTWNRDVDLENVYNTEILPINGENKATLSFDPTSGVITNYTVYHPDTFININVTGRVVLDDAGRMRSFILDYIKENNTQPDTLNGWVVSVTYNVATSANNNTSGDTHDTDTEPTMNSNKLLTSGSVYNALVKSRYNIANRPINDVNLSPINNMIRYNHNKNEFEFVDPTEYTTLSEEYNKNLKGKGIRSLKELANFIDLYSYPDGIIDHRAINQTTTVPEPSLDNLGKMYVIPGDVSIHMIHSDVLTPTDASELKHMLIKGINSMVVDTLPDVNSVNENNKYSILVGDVYKTYKVDTVNVNGNNIKVWVEVKT